MFKIPTLPYPLKATAKRLLRYGLEDFRDFASGNRKEFVPPKWRMFIGGSVFIEVGEEFFNYFLKFGGVTPHSCVLDVGCGIGRMARPFITFLSPQHGSYKGIDIDASGIKWCVNNIAKKHQNFEFLLADIYNKHYRPQGKIKASNFHFPYPDNVFDFVFATSVFTHMFFDDVSHYVHEVARVLKPGGRCLFTFFLMNEESDRLIREGISDIHFVKFDESCWVKDKTIPENAVCLSESTVRNLLDGNSLKVIEPLHYGNWCERQNFLSYQDIVIAQK